MIAHVHSVSSEMFIINKSLITFAVIFHQLAFALVIETAAPGVTVSRVRKINGEEVNLTGLVIAASSVQYSSCTSWCNGQLSGTGKNDCLDDCFDDYTGSTCGKTCDIVISPNVTMTFDEAVATAREQRLAELGIFNPKEDFPCAVCHTFGDIAKNLGLTSPSAVFVQGLATITCSFFCTAG
jgi:hypothetical protein